MNRDLIRAMGAVFYRCPNSGRVIGPSSPNDDKVLCGCGKPQPASRGYRSGVRAFAEPPGTHVKRFLPRATADDYIAQCEKESE